MTVESGGDCRSVTALGCHTKGQVGRRNWCGWEVKCESDLWHEVMEAWSTGLVLIALEIQDWCFLGHC